MKKYMKILSISFIFIIGLTIPFSSAKANEKFKICIDAGHQEKGDKRLEAIGPGDPFSKARVSSGTKGNFTKRYEYEITLECSLILKNLLENDYDIYMTREKNDINISNRERAMIGNDNNVDMAVKLHCDSIKNQEKRGASILVPAKQGKYTKNIYDKSYLYALELSKTLKNNGIHVNGIFERADLTGFNYSKVPTVLLEMGFMSNYVDDNNLCNKEYQTLLMKCIQNSLDVYRGLI